MDLREAQTLLEGTEVRLAAAQAAELHRRTEGWPAGLYLAALALQATGTAQDTPDAGIAIAGYDRFIAQYLNLELLSRLPAGQVSFLLFRDLLRAELERRQPALIPELHRRAAAWCETNGLEETAIDHAQAAGDANQVARLVLQAMQPVWASGRVNTVLRWMECSSASS